MLDMQEINNAITELELGQTTYANVQKLANLYTVRANNIADSKGYSQASAPPEIPDSSDFLRLVQAVDQSQAWLIMDELMQTLSVISPRVYDQIIFKLSKI